MRELHKKSPSATPTIRGVVTTLLNLLDVKRASMMRRLRTNPARERPMAVNARTVLVSVENIILSSVDRDVLQDTMVGGTSLLA